VPGHGGMRGCHLAKLGSAAACGGAAGPCQRWTGINKGPSRGGFAHAALKTTARVSFRQTAACSRIPSGSEI
jgi:hypothetical protein